MDDQALAWVVPQVTTRETDFAGHDLAVDAVQVLAGTFQPLAPKVVLEVESCFAIWGTARGALLLYVGQPHEPGSLLYDAGGKAIEGCEVHSAASVNGESGWGAASSRRFVLDVDPDRPVTWQILGGIIGASAIVDVPGCESIAITPDGTRAFVTSPSTGTVTPIVLGRPGYSWRRDLDPQDVASSPVPVGERPSLVSADDAHVLVSCAAELVVLAAEAGEVLHRVALPAGAAPLGSALTPGGDHAVVGTSTGRVLLVDVERGTVEGSVDVGGSVRGVGVLADGSAAFVCDSEGGFVHRIGLPSMAVESSVEVGDSPWVVRVSPDAEGLVWVLSRPAKGTPGRLRSIDPALGSVVSDIELPFELPHDFALVPVAGQTCDVVHTAWVVYEDRYSEINIAGNFAGQVHTWHNGAFVDFPEGLTGVAVNDFGEIWVVRSRSDLVWKWPGGRIHLRPGVFFGEYCTVNVYGAATRSP